MQRTILYGLLFISFACKEVQPASSASATWNGQNWQADKVKVSVNTRCAKGLLTLSFERTRQGTYLVERLAVYKVPLAVRSHRVQVIELNDYCNDKSIHSSIFTVVDEDQSKDTLPTTGLPSDVVNITAYDAQTGRIEGTFAGVYVIRKGDVARTLSDTVRVTNGVFSATVQR